MKIIYNNSIVATTWIVSAKRLILQLKCFISCFARGVEKHDWYMDWHRIIMDWNVAYQWCCVALWASKTVDHACEFWSVRQVSVITNRKSTNHSSNLLYLNTLPDVYFNRLLKFCEPNFLKYLWRATTSVKIAEALCCLLTLPMLVS